MKPHTLVLTLNSIGQLVSLQGEDLENGLSLICKVESLQKLVLQEDAVLVITFAAAELRLSLSLNDLKSIRDEDGRLVFGDLNV